MVILGLLLQTEVQGQVLRGLEVSYKTFKIFDIMGKHLKIKNSIFRIIRMIALFPNPFSQFQCAGL